MAGQGERGRRGWGKRCRFARLASVGGTEMQAEQAGVKAPGAWHPKRRPPAPLLPPLAHGLPFFLFLQPPHPITYLRGRAKFKTFLIYIFFCCKSFLLGWGRSSQTPPCADLPSGGSIWGFRKKLARLHTCANCVTFKLPDSKDMDIHTQSHTQTCRKYSQTSAFSDPS